MHGKDITIPKGTEITAYVNGDIPLDQKKFEPAPEPGQVAAQQANANVSDAVGAIDIKSTPDGADITVDGKFMGNTPSSLKLPAGDHQVKVEKQGFKPWERTLTVSSGGSTSLSATLEKAE